MNRTISSLIMLLLIFVAGAFARERAVVAAAPPIEPPYLFTIPTTSLVKSLDLDVSGAGIFLEDKSALGGAIWGVGDIAQVELSMLNMVSSLKKPNHLSSVPAGGLKVALPVWKYCHGIAAGVRRSGTHKEKVNAVAYKEKVGGLYVVTSIANFLEPGEGATTGDGWKGIKIRTHLGVDYVNARLTPSTVEEKNFWRPIGGIEIWRGNSRIPFARIMAELGWNVHFKNEEQIKDIWVVTGGMRFFWHSYGTIDFGARYQSNYEGLSELAMQAQFRLHLPTHLLRDRIVGVQ